MRWRIVLLKRSIWLVFRACFVMALCCAFAPGALETPDDDPARNCLASITCIALPNFSRRVSPHEVKHFFAQIDRNGVKRLFHGTRLLAVT
jgi:hypothetical protein